MRYVQNEEHFRNILKRIVSQHSEFLDRDKMLEPSAYYREAKPYSLDQFTWACRNSPEILHEEGFWNWIKSRKDETFFDYQTSRHNWTSEFIERIQTLDELAGVYSFWTQGGTPLYVGVSVNLASRICSSFSERFSGYKKPIYLRVITCSGPSDARVLEAYFIAKFKPAFNEVGSSTDPLTVKIMPEPEFSESILCNFITIDTIPE